MGVIYASFKENLVLVGFVHWVITVQLPQLYHCHVLLEDLQIVLDLVHALNVGVVTTVH